MMRRVIFAAATLLALPAVALAADYVYDVEILPAAVENVLELVNVLVAVVAAAFAIKLAALSQGGALEKSWNKLAIAAVIFALVEVVAALKGFKLVHLGGLGDILELAFIVIFLTVFVQTRKNLLQQVLGRQTPPKA